MSPIGRIPPAGFTETSSDLIHRPHGWDLVVRIRTLNPNHSWLANSSRVLAWWHLSRELRESGYDLEELLEELPEGNIVEEDP